MTDYYCKRVTVRFRSPEVISRIEELPAGFISMVIEAAVAAYFDSETGNQLVELLIRRNQNHQKCIKRQYDPTRQDLKTGTSKQKDTPIKRTKGDF